MYIEPETRLNGAGWPNAAQTIDYLESLKYHQYTVRMAIIGVMAGYAPSCTVLHKGEFMKLDRGGLLDSMGLSNDADFHAQLFAAAFDKETRANAFGDAEDRLKAYVEKTAEALARKVL